MVGMIQVLGITYDNLNVTKKYHIPCHSIPHSRFEAYGKHQSLIRYMLFLYYNGCKLIPEVYTISTMHFQR